MAIKVIGFDADDTLWVNENYFREGEDAFCQLLSEYGDKEFIMDQLFKIEMQNLPIYGYGIKGFMLSMTEAALEISNGQIANTVFDEILQIGKNMLQKPVQLLGKVEEVLKELKPKYRLVLVTKGDLLDQQRKLRESGLEKYFHHVEIMSDKKEVDYEKLIAHLDINSTEFMMIGNSLKSDIIPVRKVGAQAIYVPYEITWMHERVTSSDCDVDFLQVEKISDILQHL